MKKKVLLLVIPHIGAARDLWFSGLPDQLGEIFSVKVLTTLPLEGDFCQSLMARNYEVKPLHASRQNGLKGKLFGYLNLLVKWFATRSVTLRGKSHTLITEAEGEKQKQPVRFFILNLLWNVFFSHKRFFTLLENAWKNTRDTQAEQDWLRELAPDIILFFDVFAPQHQHLIAASEKFPAAKIGVVRSWDNLTCKGALVFRFDYYLVWNEKMREELLTYYTDITDSQIVKVGGLVFDYHEVLRQNPDREKFLYHQAARGKKIVTLMLNYPDLSPDYMHHVNILTDAMEEGKFVEDICLIVRIQPGPRNKGQKEKLREKGEMILVDEGKENLIHATLEEWENDLAHFCRVSQFSDLVVNYPSTTTIDCAVYDVPTVTIGFNEDPNIAYHLSNERIVHRTHYQWLAKCQGNKIATNGAELVEAINQYLNNPAEDHEGRKTILSVLIEDSVGDSARRYMDFLTRAFVPRESVKMNQPQI
ncbi:MAG: hypothetical protein SF052_16735 [Bacteroidia bacterium]|nr:hypothetical protein [Bacteroidia bacterium]